MRPFVLALVVCASCNKEGTGSTVTKPAHPGSAAVEVSGRSTADYRGQTVVIAFVDEPVGQRLVYEDDEYSFWGRGYGTGGIYVPAFFVHAKRVDRWMQILEVWTVGGKFGRSPDEPLLMVNWDYSPLRNQPFVPLPLIASSFVNNPDEVQHVEHMYVLRFSSRLARTSGDPAVLTRLRIKRDELDEAARLAASR